MTNTAEKGVPVVRHALYEDVLAIIMATLFIAFGVSLYSKALLVTGGTAGLALLLHHATSADFWLVFSIINLPFYVLAIQRMGWHVALRTFLAVNLVAAFTRFMPGWVDIGHLNPIFATVIGGGLMGSGLLMLFRHCTALGGINILAMFVQERWGLRAGYFQLGLDLAILAASFFVLKTEGLALSVLGAVVVNMILAINHRPGRYLGMS